MWALELPRLRLHIYEASREGQERLIEQVASNSLASSRSQAVDSSLRPLADPYGSALWPSALVLAQGLAAYELSGKQVLELGAGCGLASLVVGRPRVSGPRSRRGGEPRGPGAGHGLQRLAAAALAPGGQAPGAAPPNGSAGHLRCRAPAAGRSRGGVGRGGLMAWQPWRPRCSMPKRRRRLWPAGPPRPTAAGALGALEHPLNYQS